MLAVLPLVAFGRTLSVPPLPPSEFADTEVSTNIAIGARLQRLERLRFVLELAPTATNDIEVLIGHDADGNGALSVVESDIAFGYDCGNWFVRKGENLQVEECPAGGRARRELSVHCKDFAPDWDLVKVVRRGLSAADESVSLVGEHKHFMIFVR